MKGTATVIDETRPLQPGEVPETITCNALQARKQVPSVKRNTTVIDNTFQMFGSASKVNNKCINVEFNYKNEANMK